ncbi:MAG: protein kinase, partial [Sandaracinaceae bacterium]
PVYTAPEQSRQSARVDHRADIYSVGVLLYELLTGRAPFVAPNLQQLMMMHACDTATPLLELRPDLPPAVASVIGRCLEKAPEDRFGSVTQLAEAWESAWFGRSLEELPLPRLTSLSPTPRPRPRPRPARANEGAPSPPSWLGRVALAGALLVVAAVTYAVAHRYVALSSGDVLSRDNSQAMPLTSRP